MVLLQHWVLLSFHFTTHNTVFPTLFHLTPTILFIVPHSLQCQSSCSYSSTETALCLELIVHLSLHQLVFFSFLKHFIPLDAFLILAASDHLQNNVTRKISIPDSTEAPSVKKLNSS